MQVYVSQNYNVNVLGASWGKENVTDKVRALVQQNGLQVQADNQHLGDGWPHHAKALVVVYQLGYGKVQVAIAKEGDWIKIASTNQVTQGEWVQPGSVHVFGAVYGLGDVTAAVRQRVQNNAIELHVDNNLGDHWPGVAKVLTVVYQDATGIHTKVVEENQVFKTQGGFVQGGFQNYQVNGFNNVYLDILGAVYGKTDVTKKVRSLIQNGQLNVKVDNEIFGDGWSMNAKALVVVSRYGHGNPVTTVAKEGETIKIVGTHEQHGYFTVGTLAILGAAWGLKDVTNVVRQRVHNNTVEVPLDNGVLGEGWDFTRKALVVVYQQPNGEVRTAVAAEGETGNLRI